MPMKPKTSCCKSGCNKLTNSRFCDIHKSSDDSYRGNSNSRGYNYKWAQYTKVYKFNNPLCRECEKNNKLTPTKVVDHIKPIKGQNDPLFWDGKNHQPLCLKCHSIKTYNQDGALKREG